jgi:hypothetical protein
MHHFEWEWALQLGALVGFEALLCRGVLPCILRLLLLLHPCINHHILHHILRNSFFCNSFWVMGFLQHHRTGPAAQALQEVTFRCKSVHSGSSTPQRTWTKPNILDTCVTSQKGVEQTLPPFNTHCGMVVALSTRIYSCHDHCLETRRCTIERSFRIVLQHYNYTQLISSNSIDFVILYVMRTERDTRTQQLNMEKTLDYCNSEIHTIDIFRYDMRSFRYDMRSDNNDACIQISRVISTDEACLGLVFTSYT